MVFKKHHIYEIVIPITQPQTRFAIYPRKWLLLQRIANRPHSSMDRISDSGSEDLGSNPDGVTE